jgi:hypothetical protein
VKVKKRAITILFLLLFVSVSTLFIYYIHNDNVLSKIEDTDARNFDNLVWKKYSHPNLGVSFLYPENLRDSQCFEKKNTSLLISSDKRSASICDRTGHIVSITNEGEIRTSLKNWIEESNLLEGFVKTINLNGSKGYYYEITQPQQVPSDVYILEHQGNVITISVYKPSYRDSYEDKIIQKVISSIKFL